MKPKMDLAFSAMRFNFKKKRHIFAKLMFWSKNLKIFSFLVNIRFCKNIICRNTLCKLFIHQKQTLLQEIWDHSVHDFVMKQSFALQIMKHFTESIIVEFDQLSQIFHNRCEIYYYEYID